MDHFQKQAKYVAKPLKYSQPLGKAQFLEDEQDETMKNA